MGAGRGKKMTDPSGNTRLLAELAVTAERLNLASDELNQALQTIQDQIIRTGVGIAVWIPIEGTREWTGEDGPFTEWNESHLGFDRYGDGWSLLTRHVAFCEEDGEGNESWEYSNEKPLLRSPRELRLAAVRTIPDLVRGVHKAALATLDLVAEAKALAASGASDLPAPPDPSDPNVVKCLATSRYLYFDPRSWRLIEQDRSGPEQELITLSVMGSETSPGDRAMTICTLSVTRDDLMRALEHVTLVSSDTEDRFHGDIH
jgi:hypothetical protein